MKTRDQLLKKKQKSLKTGLVSDRQLCASARNKVIQTMWKAKANFFMSITESAKGNMRFGKTLIN